MRLPWKKAISWLVILFGSFAGFFALGLFGQLSIPDSHFPPNWLMDWFAMVGVALFGLVSLAGSFVAAHNRRNAALLFLASAPIVGFCLAYSSAVFDSIQPGDENRVPGVSVFAIVALLVFFPLFALLATIRNPRRASGLFLLSASVVTVCLFSPTLRRPSHLLVPALTVASAPFLVLGLFWLVTHRFGWPAVLPAQTFSWKRRLTTLFVTCLVVAALDIPVTLALAARRSSGANFGCGKGPRLFAQPLSSRHAVFTARLIRVAHTQRVSGRWVGEWAIGAVQDRFWGLPSWSPRLILLTNNFFWEGETYFVDGGRPDGWLTSLLPIIDSGFCSRTRPVVEASLELRVLREGPPKTGVRIVGYVRGPERSRRLLEPPKAPVAFPGATLTLTASAGTTIVATTDHEGFYEIDGLPPDNYMLKLPLPETQAVRDFSADERYLKKDSMAQTSLIEQDFDVVWNGTLEGKVSDSTRSPAQAWLLLENADAVDPAAKTVSFRQSDKTGAFRIAKIPPGRYVLTINPYGPSKDSPFGTLYYPETARALEVAQGQHIKHLNFSLSRLAERNLKILVTWPDGQPSEGAWVHIAYEHRRAYTFLKDAPAFAATDYTGSAEIKVFGDSRIQVFAEQGPNEQGTLLSSHRYSKPVELRAEHLPDTINLVLSSSELASTHSP
jgi:hypothetical protein